MSGPMLESDVIISTSGLNQLLQYEPRDLTVSVESGMRFSELQTLLSKNGQTIALDPPFWNGATIGGVIASNCSGPMRYGFGTARDMVIGMSFAMLDGAIAKTGGMVVKNVAGLDIGKLMIGSFGTLAAMTSVNLRVHSLPRETRTFVFGSTDLETALDTRTRILRSAVQPIAIDLLSPAAAARLGRRGYILAARAMGSPATLDRYQRGYESAEQLNGDAEASLWQRVREFCADFLVRQRDGVVVRISSTLSNLYPLLRSLSSPVITRAGSGVAYVCLTSVQSLAQVWATAVDNGCHPVVEFAPETVRRANELWPAPTSTARSSGFDIMKRVKQMFDPHTLLNRSRVHGRI